MKKAALQAIVNEHVAKPSALSTDELASYGLASKDGYVHGMVRHGAGNYVSGPLRISGAG